MTNKLKLRNGPQLAVEPPLLKEQAYTKLKQEILQGELPAGSFLSERRLVDLLGMSKTPIRAALERLQAEDYITVSPRQGIVVREPSIREISEQYEVRLVLECYVLKALAGTLSAEQAQRVQENLKLQEDAAHNSNLSRYIELDREFHLLFCEFLGNREIVRVVSHLWDKFCRVSWLVFRKEPSRMQLSWKEHAEIARAVIRGKTDEAIENLTKHTDRGKRSLLNA